MYRFGAALTILWLSTPAIRAQDYPLAWNLAHPDAKALAGVNLRSLGESQVVQKLKSQFEASPYGTLSWKGMGLLKEIDQVFISSPAAKTADPKQNPPVLIIVTGHFTAESLGQVFQGPHRAYQSVEIYGLPESKNLSMAKLNATTLLIGDEASLRGAVDRSTRAETAPAALLGRAAKMAQAHDLWVIGTVSPSALQPANVSFGKIASGIRGFETGFSLRDGFTHELSVTMATAEQAHEMAQQFSGQLQAAVTQNLGAQDGADLLNRVEVTSEGPRIHFKIALNQDEVDRVIRKAQASRQKAEFQPPSLIAQPKTIEQPKTIKIYGLDDGVREIPLGASK
jgi:hypothetical protein